MTEMIECVARAIEPETFALPRINLNREVYERAYRRARAAIEAMREPTEDMQKAIPPQSYTIDHYHGTGHHHSFPTLCSGPLSVWHSMIDAALSKATPSQAQLNREQKP